MKSKLLLFALFATILTPAAPPVEEGKTIFTTRCAGCHNITKQVVGPALAGVDQRRSLEWIINFVHSSQSLIKQGDKDAAALFKQFNNVPMPDHKDLSAENIKSVLAYINTEAAASEKKVPVTDDKKAPVPTLLETILKTPVLLFIISILALTIAAAALFAYQVNQYRRKVMAAK